MVYEIDIQKALSFPHCTEVYYNGQARCAIGAVVSAINFETPIYSPTSLGVEKGRFLFENGVDPAEVAKRNDTVVDDQQRDLLRRKLIQHLLKMKAVVPCAKDVELAKELAQTVNSCQTV